PDNEDAHYYLCKQRLLCGEGESLLADLCDFWQRYPSTQADDLVPVVEGATGGRLNPSEIRDALTGELFRQG
ncbi:hypothetical protein MJI69_28345, partial [Salmonella enterica subsp. enterica serovar Anatum]|nr:hypothetical protein [Salmonella enterica subsp. enterica serovar Anatum]